MGEDNIDITSHSSKLVDAFHGQHFDYLITVCDEASKKQLKGLSFDEKIHFSIPDPASFQGGNDEIMEEFRRVREIIKKKMLIFIGKTLHQNSEAAA